MSRAERGRVHPYARGQVLAWPLVLGCISVLMVLDLGIDDPYDRIILASWFVFLIIWIIRAVWAGVIVRPATGELWYRGFLRRHVVALRDIDEFYFVDGINWMSLGSIVVLREKSGRRIPLICLGQLAERRHRDFLRAASASIGERWSIGG